MYTNFSLHTHEIYEYKEYIFLKSVFQKEKNFAFTFPFIVLELISTFFFSLG